MTKEEMSRIRRSVEMPFLRACIAADISRLNVLYMIMQAGSGHIGSSFSSMDLVTWLWSEELRSPNSSHSDADIYFSSKGHDAPALYATLISLGLLDFDLIHKLRRLGGLPGHPDVSTPYIAANTGSLGMGLSKAYGIALANRLSGRTENNIVVMTGDGELQEGQIWESLQPIANAQLSKIIVVVDHNKYQSDAPVSAVSDLGDIESKFTSFGWFVSRLDGHSFEQIHAAFAAANEVTDRPKLLLADTIKGRGVSFMEGIALGDQTYRFHAGAPNFADYELALEELRSRIDARLSELGLAPLAMSDMSLSRGNGPRKPQQLLNAYGSELLSHARASDRIVVLDADLASDCGIEGFSKELPAQFLQCGIAEQHMVSVAGGLALHGYTPIVHSFAAFLSARANEQIYNNATENTQIVYVGTLAGVVPGGPGHSHQAIRDIAAFASVPGAIAIEPSSEWESRQAIKWALSHKGVSYIRFVNVPVELPYEPVNTTWLAGQGWTIREGGDVAFVASGPVLLREAFLAAGLLQRVGVEAAVIALPWLNSLDDDWARSTFDKFPVIIAIANHCYTGSQASMLARWLRGRRNDSQFVALTVDVVPQCGSNAEVLQYHGLDASALANTALLYSQPPTAVQ